MSTEVNETEKKILDAAKKIFELLGFAGARMQLIANEAGISKASLHYYFRSKENLFDRIFNETMDEFMVVVSTWEDTEENWEVKLRKFILEFFNFLETNSLLFILREVSRNPEFMLNRKKKNKPKRSFIAYFEDLKLTGEIEKVNVPLMLVFMHSLCSYPLLNKNFFKIATRLDDKEFDAFMKEYPNNVADLMINLIKKK